MSALRCPDKDCPRSVEVSDDDPDSSLSDLAAHLAGPAHSFPHQAVPDLLALAQVVPCP